MYSQPTLSAAKWLYQLLLCLKSEIYQYLVRYTITKPLLLIGEQTACSTISDSPLTESFYHGYDVGLLNGNSVELPDLV